MEDRYISAELRRAVFDRDNYTCQYCGCSGDDVCLEIDHIIPVSRGGVSDIRNLVTACEACNRSKSDKLISHEALQELAERINSAAEYLEGLITDGERKPKAENADRVQITVYVRGSVYEGLKTLAQVKSLNISDIAAKAIDRVVEQNSQTIAIAQQALRNLAALNVEI